MAARMAWRRLGDIIEGARIVGKWNFQLERGERCFVVLGEESRNQLVASSEAG